MAGLVVRHARWVVEYKPDFETKAGGSPIAAKAISALEGHFTGDASGYHHLQENYELGSLLTI
jgi:hypothetical protein